MRITPFTDFPELRDKIKFVGSVKGRVAALEDVKYTELCKLNPGMQDDVLRKYAKNWAKRMAGCSSSTYAYSSKNFTEYALNGLAFNSTWAGTKVKKQLEYDVQHKFHPVGCDTVKAVFDHELGHKIDEMLSLYTDPDFWLSTIRPKLKENDSSPITCRHMRIAPLSSVSPITRRKRNLLPKRGASIGITKNRDLWQSR